MKQSGTLPVIFSPSFCTWLSVSFAHGSQRAMAAQWTCAQSYISPASSQDSFIKTQSSRKLVSFPFLQILSRKPQAGLHVKEEKEHKRENTFFPAVLPGVSIFSSIRADFSHENPFTYLKVCTNASIGQSLSRSWGSLLSPICDWVWWDRVRNYTRAGKLKPIWCLLQRLLHGLACLPLQAGLPKLLHFPLCLQALGSCSSTVSTSRAQLGHSLPLLLSGNSRSPGTLWF